MVAQPRQISDESADALLDELRRESAPPAASCQSLRELAASREPEGGGDSTPADALLEKVRLRVRVELGRRRMRLDEALALVRGDVVDLGRPAGAPVEVFVGEIPLARGEVVVVDGRLAVRVTEILSEPAAGAMEAKS